MLWTAPRRVESLSFVIVFLGASRWPPQNVIRYMASQPDISDLLQREMDAAPGTFLGGIRFDLRWDQGKFDVLCAALHSVAIEHARQENLPRGLSQLFWYCGT